VKSGSQLYVLIDLQFVYNGLVFCSFSAVQQERKPPDAKDRMSVSTSSQRVFLHKELDRPSLSVPTFSDKSEVKLSYFTIVTLTLGAHLNLNEFRGYGEQNCFPECCLRLLFRYDFGMQKTMLEFDQLSSDFCLLIRALHKNETQ
jgi:hypothetical protein